MKKPVRQPAPPQPLASEVFFETWRKMGNPVTPGTFGTALGLLINCERRIRELEQRRKSK